MNIEQAFIKSVKVERVVELVRERLSGSLKDIRLRNQMSVPDSYEIILANEAKRKVAISYSCEGWISIIESKEVNDYAMLVELSRDLKTEVFAVLQSDIIGAWGYVEISEGEIIKSYFSEENDEIEDLLDDKLRQKRIRMPLYMFREVVKERGNGWNIAQAHIQK